MKKTLSTLLLSAGALFSAAQQAGDHVPGQALVMLYGGHDVQQVLDNAYLINGNASGIKVNKAVGKSMNIWLLDFDPSADEPAVLEKIRATGGVAIAQFNHYIQQRAVPNDTYFGSMWGLNNTGQNGGTPDADIDAPEAWDITTGGLTALGDTIVVAVVDGGFQISHTDINFWKNYNEIPANGMDDDGNGYIDDVNGWNAYNSNGTLQSNSHGTHVAGTVGAKGNNNSGTTGVSWNVKVMAVMGSTTTESEAVEAYTYILDNRRLYDQTNGAKGAFVVATNSSFGVDQGQPAAYPLWCAMYDSLGAAGILSATATANQNWDIDAVGDIPTGCSSQWMIAVTNTTRYDVKYTSAGYGATTIDLGAPGTSVYSTVPTNNWQSSGWTGTSMATPHVAGTIGLMYAAACQQFMIDYKNDPSGMAMVMQNYLLSGVDMLSSMNGLCVTGGRLNANNALLNVQSYSACTTTAYTVPAALDKMDMRNVFPNPTAGRVELEYVSNEDNFDVVVKDIFGKTVKVQRRSNHKGINKHKLDLDELPSGVYMIGVEGMNAKSRMMRVVKI